MSRPALHRHGGGGAGMQHGAVEHRQGRFARLQVQQNQVGAGERDSVSAGFAEMVNHAANLIAGGEAGAGVEA